MTTWQQRVRATQLANPPPPPDEHAGSISAWRRGWIACWRGAHRSECRHKATRLVAAWQAGYAACAVAIEGNGTMTPCFFTAPCLHNPSDSLKVKVVGYGERGLDVNVRENGRYYAAVLSAPDAARLCAYLIEQGFGPKAPDATKRKS